ncbi:MAG: hypothetical protein A3C85_00115 [Candidatus Doudnabacteria bacterium RIFCSPHIGHO2_02_FULL_48_21]|nr:MAG: hypothetical protein A2668_00805 [Candidatus Doudnabacteria bacterium RIFCSPHIGHO2_01_FULL_48_180]OGE94187.1 MAG: hypothetical protein A3C85_00115 [Candidatus Doudnabacteria bacterium RIFCSPHIGHO2_02_FULL_48_21]OGE98164.1 MAG: hypothetical protein A3A83_03270 [Candidatus Doudnabacteria bacterium RIFCSPLOWO2_01_FULL_48_57]
MIDAAKNLIEQILKASKQLSLITKRPFTPDGHMVGSIGEVYAQQYYGVELYPPSHQEHDGLWQGRQVQIKATQRISVELKGPSDLLLVLKINPDGSFEEIYNGDGKSPWQSLSHRKVTRAGEISISLGQLKKLNALVKNEDKMPRVK